MSTVHGGDIIDTAKSIGCEVSDLIDMSSNLSPLNFPSGLRQKLISGISEIAYLPETGSGTLKDMFAHKYGLATEQFLVGNGTTEFIYAVPAALGAVRSIIINPAYSDYQQASVWAGTVPESFTLRYKDYFHLHLNKLKKCIKGGELIFVCNPNNPTGVLTSNDDLYDFILAHKESNFLIDETYLPFTQEKSLLNYPITENIFLLRSFSKIYGIPGLRLGFLISSSQNLTRFMNKNKPWGVNRLAQIAGAYLVENGDPHINETVTFLGNNRSDFIAELNKLPNLDVIPGAANFILCHLSGDIRANEIREELLKHRIMIRNCETFPGLSDRFFRLNLKDPASNNQCIRALKSILR